MAVLRIHTIPNDDEFLRRRCAEVTEFGPALRQIAADMLETLPTLGGIGLAAPQVGHSIRMVLVDLSDSGDPEDEHKQKPLPEQGLVAFCHHLTERGDAYSERRSCAIKGLSS